MTKYLNLQKINKNNFRKYGDVISTNDKKSFDINSGFANKFDNLAKIKIDNNSLINFSIYKVKHQIFPLTINMMEKHPLASQIFFPLTKCNFLVVVAPKGNLPEIDKIETFLVPPNTGINYDIGIWHYPLISTTDSEFIVIDRKTSNDNLIIHNFQEEKIILKYE